MASKGGLTYAIFAVKRKGSGIPVGSSLHLGIVKLPAQQPLEPEECSLDIGHLAGLGGHTNLSLLFPKGHMAGGCPQRVVIGNCLNTSLPMEGAATTHFNLSLQQNF